MSKTTTNKKYVETVLTLNDEYVNINRCIDYKLIAPNGDFIEYRMNIENKLINFLNNLGVTIEEVVRFRPTRKYNIGGVKMAFEAPNKLIYLSDTEPIANTRYYSTKENDDHMGIKEDLIERGYNTISHTCVTKELGEIEHSHPCIVSAKLDTY
jgi:hypothetical protein